MQESEMFLKVSLANVSGKITHVALEQKFEKTGSILSHIYKPDSYYTSVKTGI